jgi:hypothetical protein
VIASGDPDRAGAEMHDHLAGRGTPTRAAN